MIAASFNAYVGGRNIQHRTQKYPVIPAQAGIQGTKAG